MKIQNSLLLFHADIPFLSNTVRKSDIFFKVKFGTHRCIPKVFYRGNKISSNAWVRGEWLYHMLGENTVLGWGDRKFTFSSGGICLCTRKKILFENPVHFLLCFSVNIYQVFSYRDIFESYSFWAVCLVFPCLSVRSFKPNSFGPAKPNPANQSVCFSKK